MNKTQVIKKIGKKNWNDFCKFMEGQTTAIDENGEIDFYKCDVNNFLNKLKGKPTFFD